MPDFIYPTNAELQEIAQEKLPRLTADRAIFRIMPVRNVDAALLMWEQQDDYKGLQQVRGLNGQPSRVYRVGAKRYQAQPGVYGEFTSIDELELTVRRQYGSWDRPVDIEDLVMEAQDQLLLRRFDRLELIGWTLLTLGTFSVSTEDGRVMHTDSFALQTFTASVAWSTYATATPIKDLRALKLLARGRSVNFGRAATLYLNQITVNHLLANTNQADLGGKKTANLSAFTGLNDVNRVLLEEDLPQIEVMDEGYFNEAGTFVPFIADNKGVLVGSRPAGQVIADYAMTRNANNPNMAPGAYMKVVDSLDRDEVPRRIDVHDGHNGGPRIYHPGAVVRLNV